MTQIQVRLAQIDDANAIAMVHVKTWQYAYRGQMPDEFLDSMSIEERAARWRENLMGLNLQERVLVAEVDGKLVGFAVVGRSRDKDTEDVAKNDAANNDAANNDAANNDAANDKVGELYTIHVDAQSMNHGVGSALLKIGQAYLAEQGFERATLWVLASNGRARRFYERKGWAADGATRSRQIANTVVPEVRYAIQFANA